MKNFRRFSLFGILLPAAIMAFFLTGCRAKGPEGTNPSGAGNVPGTTAAGSDLLKNPIKVESGAESLAADLGFSIPPLSYLPSGTVLSSCLLISGDTGEMNYSGGAEITHRFKKGTMEQAGLFADYPDKTDYLANSTAVDLRGADSLVYVAFFTHEEISHSLYFPQGIDKEEAQSIVNGILSAAL